MGKSDFFLGLGILTVLTSIFSSIIFGFHYWYSFYVVGAFIFFGSLNFKSGSSSVFSYILNKKYGQFMVIYFLATLFGLLIDIIYGRNIARLWYYPHLFGWANFLVPVFLYYPFGGLQVYEIFYFVKSLMAKKFGSGLSFKLSEGFKNSVSTLLIIVLIIGFVLPLINFWVNSNRYANELMIFFMIATTFAIDAPIYKIKKESILFDFIQGNQLIILTMIISWLVCALLTEIPNTFSWEWIYYNIPFTALEIFKINVLIFTLGWFFLVFVTVRLIDLTKIVFGFKN